jgi:hypothetical protein
MRGIEIREAVPSGGTSKALRCLEELDEGGGGRKGRAVAKSERATLRAVLLVFSLSGAHGPKDVEQWNRPSPLFLN